MQLGVVGSKLKRLSTWSIWPMVENSGFQADLRYREWYVGIIISIHLTNFLYQCNLITHNMGKNSVRSLIPCVCACVRACMCACIRTCVHEHIRLNKLITLCQFLIYCLHIHENSSHKILLFYLNFRLLNVKTEWRNSFNDGIDK